MNRYLAVTTCNEDQWKKYGRAMAATFCRHWPDDVPLYVYTEDFDPGGELPVEQFIDLDIAAPWLGPWKAERSEAERGRANGKYTFRRDAVRFAHKIAAIGAAAASANDVDVLIWMDADTVTHTPVTVRWLDELFPAKADVAWLDRENCYPECGFLMFRLPETLGLIHDFVTAYRTGAIFRYPETHDSFVIQQVVNGAVRRGEIKVGSLSGDAKGCHHPFVAGPLGSRLDHLKGARKELGKSKPTDLLTKRTEPYWRWQ